MRDAHWLIWGVLSLVLGATACGDDDLVLPDAGPPPVDQGMDAGDPQDLGGEDLGADDLGPDDLGPDDLGADDLGSGDAGPPDLGAPCSGPPGLYIEGSCTILAPGVRPYSPRYVLWSDAAQKDRFISLPSGTQIDTSNPNGWIYPVGTKLWKTFSRDGVRLETRLLEKFAADVGPVAWRMRVFAWNAEQNRVMEVTEGRMNVLGTDHDIPSQADCLRCHDNATRDASLSFTAIQLNHAGTPLSLQTLLDEGRLSHPIATSDAVVPGDPMTRDALGYLHANCGHCHGGPTPQAGMRLWVDVGLRTVEETGTWLTAVDQISGWLATVPPTVTARIEPGMPDSSAVVRRMALRGSPTMTSEYANQMPPLGTKRVDESGLATVRAWIESLP
jgi:hypothetical protein